MTRSSPDTGHQSIRAGLTRVGLVPAIILLAIWLVFTTVPVYQAIHTRATAAQVRDVAVPAVTALDELRTERGRSVEVLSGLAAADELRRERDEADPRIAGLRQALRELAENGPAPVAAEARDLDSLLTQLPRQRRRVDTGQANRAETLDYYGRVLDSGMELFETRTRLGPDLDSGHAGHVATELFRAAEQMSGAAALGAAALAEGEFTRDEHLEFTRLIGAYRDTLETELPAAQGRAEELGRELTGAGPWQQLSELEDQLVEFPPQRSGSFDVDSGEWQRTTGEVADDLSGIALAQVRASADLGVHNADGRLTGIVVSGLVALAAMLLGILLAVRNARQLVNKHLVSRLESLRDDTLALASHRLPGVVERLERGEEVDAQAELAPLDYGADEIGQVADAFNTAHHTAISAAINQNQAKSGANKVFLGIAHRNQGLVHRQLKVLDEMERSEEHPERLDGLFRLDHLATRARRNAENLIILAGEKPGRQWRKPVRLVDVVRSAVAETEHYYRFRVHPTPDVSLIGAAVGDVIHLLAELMDNATSFSTPRSQVEVRSSDTPRGVLVQIADEGLGMRPEDLAAANALLSSAPKFEDITLRGDSRLGLFVVARLAARRGIEVDLRKGHEQGTIAFVLLPPDIVADESVPGMPAPAEVEVTRPVPVVAEPQFPSADPDDPNELPRRVPGGGRTSQEVPVSGDTAPQTPERTRGNMTAFQKGTVEARRDAAAADHPRRSEEQRSK
ncbi:nitrate- and nitrite sensing domain-containing protein [Saccharopolyspora griseoalba]|uniref:histidine kinase n=1 Tax=Saccharopolyspora griseoalba TaxID=1431848 RepID=A0ABW2LT15_9PSEU